MKITVMSLFRDSESYLDRCLQQLSSLEESTAAEFEYYFYENDSIDNTKRILEEWISKRKGKLVSENMGTPKFGPIISGLRSSLMSIYRNILLDFAKPIQSNYTFVFDSDIIFDNQILNNMISYMTDEVAIVSPNVRQNIPSIYGDSNTSYYDSYALQDLDKNPAMTWADNPFYRKKDRELWSNNLPVEVSRTYGSSILIRSDILNKIYWTTSGGCEHWAFCDLVKEYGKILVVPTIITNVVIGQKTIDSISRDHFDHIKQIQEKMMESINND